MNEIRITVDDARVQRALAELVRRGSDLSPAMADIGEPEEVAAAVAFLCLPAAGYITGECIAVDGGFLRYGF